MLTLTWDTVMFLYDSAVITDSKIEFVQLQLLICW